MLPRAFALEEDVMEFRSDTLYVTDLDGTLLDSGAHLPSRALCMLNEMLDCGLALSVATARSWSSAAPLLSGLRLACPLVCYNGAFLVDSATGRDIERCLLSEEQKARVLAEYLRCGVAPMVYAMVDGRQKVSWLRSRQNDGICRYARSRAGDPRLNPVETEEELCRGDVFYFSALGAREELAHAQPCLAALDFARVHFAADTYDPEEYWLETARVDATKAIGVDKLRQLTGRKRIVCFGDNLNDLPMFSVADECYAVANAAPEVKAAATGVLPSNEELGVPRFLWAIGEGGHEI